MNALIAVVFVLLGTGMGQDAAIFSYGRCLSASNGCSIGTPVGYSSGYASSLRPSRRACRHRYQQHIIMQRSAASSSYAALPEFVAIARRNSPHLRLRDQQLMRGAEWVLCSLMLAH